MGGDICLYLAVYAYMADITTPEERTRRLAILESFIPLGLLLSIPGGTYLKTEYGFVVVFSVSMTCSLLALLYTVACVEESRLRSDYKSPAICDVDVNASEESMLRVANENYGSEFVEQLNKDLSSCSSAFERDEIVQKNVKYFVQSSAPSRVKKNWGSSSK